METDLHSPLEPVAGLQFINGKDGTVIHHGGVVNWGIVRTNEQVVFDIRAHNTNPSAAYYVGNPTSPFSLMQCIHCSMLFQ